METPFYYLLSMSNTKRNEKANLFFIWFLIQKSIKVLFVDYKIGGHRARYIQNGDRMLLDSHTLDR